MTDELPLSAPASSETLSSEGAPVSISPIIREDTNLIDEAKKILEENKNLLLLMTTERRRIEKATAEALINGRSYAGQSQPKTETEEEKWAREAKIRYAGTGMDPTPKI